jgi:hypothetical protein
VPIADRVIASVGQGGAAIASIFVEQGRLDDVFRDITTGNESTFQRNSHPIKQ